MKIVNQTPNQLLLREFLTLSHVVSLIGGVVLTAVGLSAITSPNVTTLTCNRIEPTQGSCKLLASGLLGSEVREIPLNILHRAKLDTSTGKNTSYRVVLLTITGEVPFASYSDSFFESKAIVSRINEFVKTPGETSLTVKQNERQRNYQEGLMLTAIGFLFALFFVLTPVVRT